MPFDAARAKSLFLAASDLPDAAERAAFLVRECGADAELRARVEALLRADEPSPVPITGSRVGSVAGAAGTVDLPADNSATGTFDSNADRPASHATEAFGSDGATGTFGDAPTRKERSAPTELGTVIAGRYTLAEVIGEGGMGSVYLATQTEPVKRQVALKLIKTGMDSKAVLARFDAERQALALMDHPNIARIYDGGVTATGQPFFVMELVNGVPLTDYCDAQRLSVDARLQLFVSVCQAVQHAHQKGIIHRDLKPGNVLVTEVDGRPTPKVIDFGVAKATELKLTDMSFADTGAIVGTPAYMSPEQADPTSMDIDTRSDVYALGVMLYELLTGSPPIDGKQFKRGAILEMLRMVREVEPPRPSTKLSTADDLPNIAANRGVEPAKLAKSLQGELDWVVMKALEKDRARRYDSANGLGQDIQRYLADEVVEARPPSRGYRLKKFVKRNRTQVIAASLVLLVLIAGVIGTSVGLVRAVEARDAEAEQRRIADRARDGEKTERVKAEELADKNGKLADANAKLAADESAAKQKAVEANEETARQLALTRATIYTSQMAKAALLVDKQPMQALTLLYDVEQCPIDLRDVAWNVAVQQCKRHLVSTTSIVEFGSDYDKVVSSNGKRMVTRSIRHVPETGIHWCTLTLRELPSGRVLATTKEFSDSRDGRRLRFSDDGSRLALIANHGYRSSPDIGVKFSDVFTVYLCDVETGSLTTVQEVKGGPPLGPGGPSPNPTVAISATLLAFSGPDNTIVLWDLKAGKQKQLLKGHTAPVSAYAFSADGKLIASGGEDNAIKVWDVESGQIKFAREMPKDNPDPEFQAHKQDLKRGSPGVDYPVDGITSLDFSTDGTFLAAGNRNWLLEIWNLNKGELRTSLRGTKAGIQQAVFYGDGTTILVNGLNQWDIATGHQLLALPLGGRGAIQDILGFTNADRRLVVSRGLRSVYVLDPSAKVTERAKMVVEKLKTPSGGMAFCGVNGQLVAVGCDDRIELWDTHTGKLRQLLTGHKNPIAGFAVSPDGRILASSSLAPRTNVVVNPGTEPGPKKEPLRDDVFLWDIENGKLIGVLPINEAAGLSLAFSPDGKTIAASFWREGDPKSPDSARHVVVSVWDATTRQLRFNLEFTTSEVFAFGISSLAFNPVDGTLATAAGNSLRIWDLETRTFRELPPVRSGAFFGSIRFSPDGKTLAVGSQDGRGGGSIRFLNSRTGEPAGQLDQSGSAPVYTPDGKTIITGNGGRFHFWNPYTLQLLGSLDPGTRGWMGFLLRPDGQTLATTSTDDTGRKEVKLWDLTRPPEVVPLESIQTTFSPDGRSLVINRTNGYQFVDLDTLRIRANVWHGRTGPVTSLSPDGRILAVTGGLLRGPQPVSVEFFDTHTGARIREIKPQTTDDAGRYAGLAFSPDGRFLAVVSLPSARTKPTSDLQVTVVIFNVVDGKPLTTIRGPFNDPEIVNTRALRLVFSPDGTALLLSSRGGYKSALQPNSRGTAVVIELGEHPRFVALPLPKEVAGNPQLGTLDAIRFTSDSSRIVGRYGEFPERQPVVMWERRTGQLVEGPIPNILPGPDMLVHVSPDGRYEIRPSQLLTRPSELIDRRAKPPVLVSPPNSP